MCASWSNGVPLVTNAHLSQVRAAVTIMLYLHVSVSPLSSPLFSSSLLSSVLLLSFVIADGGGPQAEMDFGDTSDEVSYVQWEA